MHHLHYHLVNKVLIESILGIDHDRDIMIKGAGVSVIQSEILWLGALGLSILTLTVASLGRRLD